MKDFSHTIDFSALRKATSTTDEGTDHRGELKLPTESLPRMDDAPTKPTRKGLRRGSLSRSIKIFQECTGPLRLN